MTFSSSADAVSSVNVVKTTGDGVATTVALSTSSATGTTSTTTLPSGVVLATQLDATGTRTVTAPDGTVTTTTYSPDPRFGVQLPLFSTTVTTPGGLSQVTSTARTVTLSYLLAVPRRDEVI